MRKIIIVERLRLGTGIPRVDRISLRTFNGRYWWMYCVDASRFVKQPGYDLAPADFD